MSAPRPSEADVEALAEVLGDIRIAQARQADWWESDEAHPLLVRVLRGECVPWAEGLLASDWLTEHDAEHEREVVALRAEVSHRSGMVLHQQARAEAAERALADLRGEIKALHGDTHWCFDADQQPEVYEPGSRWWPCPTYALLPRDDAAGGVR